MSSAVSETELYEASVIGPDDGDARNAASVRTPLEDLANRAKWLKAALDLLVGVSKTVTLVDPATDIITVTTHGYSLNDPVRLRSVGGTVAAGLTAGTVYFVRDVTADTFKLAASAGGAAINITGAGSGTQYVYSVPDAAAALFAPATGGLSAGSLRAQINEKANAANGTHTGTTSVQTLTIGESLTLEVGSPLAYSHLAISGSSNPANIVAADAAHTYILLEPTAARSISVGSASRVGHRIRFIRTSVGAFEWKVKRVGGADEIVTLPASLSSQAEIEWYDDGVTPRWILSMCSSEAIPGLDAFVVAAP